VNLTTHLHLVLRFRMHGAISPLPLHGMVLNQSSDCKVSLSSFREAKMYKSVTCEVDSISVMYAFHVCTYCELLKQHNHEANLCIVDWPTHISRASCYFNSCYCTLPVIHPFDYVILCVTWIGTSIHLNAWGKIALARNVRRKFWCKFQDVNSST